MREIIQEENTWIKKKPGQYVARTHCREIRGYTLSTELKRSLLSLGIREPVTLRKFSEFICKVYRDTPEKHNIAGFLNNWEGRTRKPSKNCP
jgi:hypothetical protein